MRTGARGSLVAAALAALLAVPGDAPAGDAVRLYTDTTTQAAQWVEAHPGDVRATRLERIAGTPQARWFTSPDPAVAAAEVSGYVDRAVRAGAVPVVVLYALPDRDCGGASAGGAEDWTSYSRWVAAVAAGIGDRESVVLLEPDSLALQECLTPEQQRRREDALAEAVDVLERESVARVYLDGGHSDWLPVAVQAERLRRAGVAHAEGFMTNVSNFQRTSDELAYGARLRHLLGGHLEQVVDTSRNGAGPLGRLWCDPPGRRLGRAPTMRPGEEGVAAYLWVKAPGEADGCAAAAGEFVPELAVELADGTPSSANLD